MKSMMIYYYENAYYFINKYIILRDIRNKLITDILLNIFGLVNLHSP